MKKKRGERNENLDLNLQQFYKKACKGLLGVFDQTYCQPAWLCLAKICLQSTFKNEAWGVQSVHVNL